MEDRHCRSPRYQPHDSIHTLHRQTNLRCFTRVEFGMVDVIMAQHVHKLDTSKNLAIGNAF
jgi:hypothetical protein